MGKNTFKPAGCNGGRYDAVGARSVEFEVRHPSLARELGPLAVMVVANGTEVAGADMPNSVPFEPVVVAVHAPEHVSPAHIEVHQ